MGREYKISDTSIRLLLDELITSSNSDEYRDTFYKIGIKLGGAAESSGWKASKTRQFFLEYVFITQRQEDSVTLNYEYTKLPSLHI